MPFLFFNNNKIICDYCEFLIKSRYFIITATHNTMLLFPFYFITISIETTHIYILNLV